MQYERVELFPQMAICPAVFQEQDAKFTVNPTCFSQDRKTSQKTYITAISKTFTTPDKKIFNLLSSLQYPSRSCPWK